MDQKTEEKNTKVDSKFIPLSEASKRSGYTPEHLNLLSRKGKLKAEKIGRNWYTTEEGLQEFLDAMAEKKNGGKEGLSKLTGIQESVAEENTKSGTVLEVGSREDSERVFSEMKAEEKAQPIFAIDKKSSKPAWFQMLAGFSSMAIAVPMIFMVIYSAKYYMAQKKYEVQKISIINESPQEIIFNENDLSVGEDATEKVVSGIVRGEDTNANDEAAKKAGILLASENFKASQVSLGGTITVASTEENQPLEISDIKSESFITGKKDSAQGASAEEVKLVISWKTNKLAKSELMFSKNNGQDSKSIKEQSFGFNHSVILAGIDPRTSYVFQVKSRDHWGTEINSDFYGIFTASKPVSVFDLISKQINEIFGWAIKK